MQTSDELARRGEVSVRVLVGREQLLLARAMLDAAEGRAGLELVDEAERHRIERLVAGQAPPVDWRPLAAWAGERAVGYGAVVLDPRGTSTGDAAVDRDLDPEGSALRALLAAAVRLTRHEGGGRLSVWTRHAGQAEIESALSEGFEVDRRLAVMGRDLTHDLPCGPTSPARIRAYRPGEDDEDVVAVLAATYAGTDEAGWDLAGFAERTGLPWFRSEDLLVAELDDPAAPAIAGLHWLKRRSPEVGEVYNLAVHPEAQGRRLGPALLHAGLAHLREVGCREVLLWVDLANERAVRLYEAQGFAIRWQDLAVGRATA